MFSLEEEERERAGLWLKFADFLFVFFFLVVVVGGGGTSKEEGTSLDQAGENPNLAGR